MKVAWVLLLSLLLIFLLDDGECWRRRRFRLRVRVRARRILPRIRVRRVIPRIRIRRVRIRRVVPRLRRVFEVPRIRFRLRRLLGNRRDRPYVTPAPIPATTRQYNPNVTTPRECPEICAGNCPLPNQCTTWNCPCQWVCATVCEWFTEEEFLWPYDGYPAPLPCDFQQYDGDANGSISTAELAFMVRQRSRDQNNLFVFNKLDLNQDGVVTSDEFYSLLLLKDCGSAEPEVTTAVNTDIPVILAK